MKLNISSNELTDEDLQKLTRNLCDSIADETEIEAEIPSGSVAQGTKGDPITLGVLVLSFLSGGSAVALCEVFKAYFSRVPSLSIELERADGSKVKITSQNLKPEQLQTLLSQTDNAAR
uniref:effector-associated constant component EACC1 n=1 Tax=Candidatus Electronema sp. TaxID=2698783 RepID=UPI004056EE93